MNITLVKLAFNLPQKKRWTNLERSLFNHLEHKLVKLGIVAWGSVALALGDSITSFPVSSTGNSWNPGLQVKCTCRIAWTGTQSDADSPVRIHPRRSLTHRSQPGTYPPMSNTHLAPTHGRNRPSTSCRQPRTGLHFSQVHVGLGCTCRQLFLTAFLSLHYRPCC